MPNDVERIVTELEAVTGRLLATRCLQRTGEFGDLLELRLGLAARLADRRDLDGSTAERIRMVIEAGNRLVARLMAMRESLVTEMAETIAQRRFTRELGCTVPREAKQHHVDMNA